jgi:hypothetical protein
MFKKGGNAVMAMGRVHGGVEAFK